MSLDDISKVNETKAQIISRLINELVYAKKSCNLGRNSSIPQVGEKLVQESISYIVCWRFGIISTGLSFDYITDNAVEILPFMGEILGNIRTESSNLIKSLEDSFKQTCEKRGINPMVDYEPNEKKPSKPKLFQSNSYKETPQESLYHVAPRTEKTAINMDFTHYDILPLKTIPKASIEPIVNEPAHQPTSPIVNPISQNQNPANPRKHIPPDPLITITDRDKYGYTRHQELLPVTKERAIKLFKYGVTIYRLYPDNHESMVIDATEIEAHNGIFGVPHMEWYNSREYQALASGNPEAQKESDFIYADNNTFAVYQLKEGQDDGYTEPYRYQSYSQLARTGLMVDYHNYSIVYTGDLLPSESPESLYMRFNMRKPQDYSGRSMSISDVLSVQTDRSIASYYVDEGNYIELMTFIGMENKKPIMKSSAPIADKESPKQQVSEPSTQSTKPVETATTSTPIQTQSSSTEVEETQEESKVLSELPDSSDSQSEKDDTFSKTMATASDLSDVDVFSLSREESREGNYGQIYELTLMINQQCAKDIDKAIKNSKEKHTEGEYRLMEALNTVILKYGRNRIAWILSMAISNAENVAFSKENQAWAIETLEIFGFPNEPPTFSIETNPILLDVFIIRFRDLQKRNLGYEERIKKATKQVKAQAQSKSP